MTQPHPQVTTEQVRILVVDDYAPTAEVMAEALKARYANCDIRAVFSPSSALAVAENLRPQIAILDMVMPGINGVELMDLLKHIVPGLDVIFLTGTAGGPSIAAAMELGAYDYLIKPIDPGRVTAIVARCLERHRLMSTNLRLLKHMDAQLEHARVLQQRMLPSRSVDVTGGLLAWSYTPCESLGGDFIDFTVLAEGRIAAVIADVAGHGVAAAMLTSAVKTCFWISVGEGFATEALVARLRAGVQPLAANEFVTLFAFEYDPASGRLCYVNAGHPSALILDSEGGFESLEPTGPLICSALPDSQWKARTVILPDDQMLVAYTDGVVEARRGDRQFGIEGMMDSIAQAKFTPQGVATKLTDDVMKFAVDDADRDDVAVLCLKKPNQESRE